ncbi:Kinesin-like protein [Mycena venus]|uniref:Kinesin-like protein n=1 Tax=Mycena venus TaxID=2733690 RepID=A0A8H6YK94_9AGAR|nr:Kinesin-like protein [Mycena venus]
MSSKVKIAARLRPRLPGEPPDDGGVRVCHAENSSCSTGANSSLPPHDANANSSTGAGPNTSGSSTGSGASGSFTGIAVANPRDASQIFRFPFTSCYDADATQEEIFNADVRPLIDVAWSGVTVTIFAYGVTSSGKTHTMQGPPDDPGVIPRVVEALFAKSSSSSTSANETEKAEVAVSYIEIYKDDVYDLLVARENASRLAPKLPVRENEAGAVFVAGLASAPVASVRDFQGVYNTATARRSVGATLLNRASSRSHAVLTLNIKVRVLDPATNAIVKVREGKINLVDLAGSENNKLTGNDPSRMAESAAINKSLSVLGQVVHALNTGASRIPYRNAKLTRILQDALGGSSVGLLICNLSPAAKFRQDTLNTLNFAVRTKNIENKPAVNERDVRPPPPPALAPKIDLAHPPKPLAARPGARPSLVPRPTGAMRVSSVGLPGAGAYQPPSRGESRMSMIGVGHIEKEKEKMPPGLSEAEIDARIARAVEAEVARRLEEKEREREREREKEASSSRQRTKSPNSKRSPKSKGRELPPGLSPLLKRHKDLDDELQARLAELERKFERGNRDAGLADVLSPVSKKKTGRAYVALARAHSEQGNLQIALDLYRRAETYVPDNVKLKERWILFIVHVFLCRVGESASASASVPSAPSSRAASRASRAASVSAPSAPLPPAPVPARVSAPAASKLVSASRLAAAVSALRRVSHPRGVSTSALGGAHGKAIIEIEWAVKNDKAFKPSPKRPKKAKKTKAKIKEAEVEVGEMDVDVDGAGQGAPSGMNDRRARSESADVDAGQVSDDQMEVDEVESSLTGRDAFGHAFGTELTNTGSKRGVTDAGMETPAKRAKGKKQRVVMIESDEEDAYEPGAAPRKNRRRVGTVA